MTNKRMNLVFTAILLMVSIQSTYPQTYMEIDENKLLLGGKPILPELSPVPFSKLDTIFRAVRNEKIEYRYVNGSCEDRTHYISLLLRKMNIPSGKIWNFAPARITLISNELFKVRDPFGVSNTEVSWGYHVAPVFAVKNENGQIDTLVIDQSFSPNGFIGFKDWLGKMNCPRSTFTFTAIESYLFNSINGLTIYDNSKNPAPSHVMPVFMPQIITGDFWQLNANNDNVQTGLAINDLAYHISEESQGYKANERRYLLDLIQNIDNLIAFTKAEKPTEISKQTYKSLIRFYELRVNHWSNRYSSLKL